MGMKIKVLIVFLHFFTLIKAQNSCNDYVQNKGDYAIIKLKVPVISEHNVKVKVKFTTIPQGDNGDFNLDTSTEQAVSNIRSSSPITYRVRFPFSYPNAEIISIYHNGHRVCEESLGSYSALVTFDHGLDTGIRLSGSYPIPFDYRPNDVQTIQNLPPKTVQPTYSNSRPNTGTRFQNYRPTNNQFHPKQPIPVITQKPISNSPQQSFTCGERKGNNAVSLSIGGIAANPHEFPWLVAHFYTEEGFICGGSLVSRKIVVTAAHCIQDKGKSRRKEYYSSYYLGKHVLRSTIEKSIILSEVVKFEIHDDWNPYDSNYKGDIAIAILSKTIEFNRAIQPICIWTNTQSYYDLMGKRGIVAGWGLTEKGRTSDVPQYINIPVVGEIECINSNPLFSNMISSQSFCAGKESGQIPCQGDSGGGFIVKNSNKYFLRGIVSAGIVEDGICSSENYALFTDVSQYTDWIYSFINTYG